MLEHIWIFIHLVRWWCKRFSCIEKSRHWSSYGYCRFGRVQTSCRHDFAGRQLCLNRDRSGRRTIDLRQPEEINRLHSDFEHSRNLTLSRLHPLRHSSTTRYRHYPLHRSWNWHGKCFFPVFKVCLSRWGSVLLSQIFARVRWYVKVSAVVLGWKLWRIIFVNCWLWSIRSPTNLNPCTHTKCCKQGAGHFTSVRKSGVGHNETQSPKSVRR